MITLSFPFTKSITGGAKTETDPNEINFQMLRQLICTDVGERPWQPEYGCRIHELTWSPLTPANVALAKYYIQKAIETFLPAIKVTVQVSFPDEEVMEILINNQLLTLTQ